MASGYLSPVLVGLDVGTTKVAVVVARQDPETDLHILGVGYCPCIYRGGGCLNCWQAYPEPECPGHCSDIRPGR